MKQVSFEQMQAFKYGKRLSGSLRTFKGRYKTDLAELIISHLPLSIRWDLMLFITRAGKTFIALEGNQKSDCWFHLERAIALGKKEYQQALKPAPRQLELA